MHEGLETRHVLGQLAPHLVAAIPVERWGGAGRPARVEVAVAVDELSERKRSLASEATRDTVGARGGRHTLDRRLGETVIEAEVFATVCQAVGVLLGDELEIEGRKLRPQVADGGFHRATLAVYRHEHVRRA